MPDPVFTSIYTGQQVESAIGKALQFSDFALVTDETIGGIVYHVLWKAAPAASNTVSGVAVHPSTGRIYAVISVNGVKSVEKYLRGDDSISSAEIDNILNS